MRLRRGFSVCVQGLCCFQSYGLERFRVLGHFDTVLDNLDRHSVDELMIISPRSNPVNGKFTSIALEELAKRYIPVPLIQAGHLEDHRTFDTHADLGFCERFVFTRALYDQNTYWIDRYAEAFGAQAIIGCFQVSYTDSTGPIFLSDGKSRPLTAKDIDYAFEKCDEVIIQQINRFGHLDGFDLALLSRVDLELERTILNGGVGYAASTFAASNGLAAVYFDNSTFHKEGRA